MTALSVLPLAAFTTLAVLGGGNRILPDWLKIEEGWESPEGESELEDSPYDDVIFEETQESSSDEDDVNNEDEIDGDE